MGDLIQRLRENPRTNIFDLCEEAADEIERLRAALESCLKNDKTEYEHHEPRPFDGLSPDVDGGTIWRTPREIARAALSAPNQLEQQEVDNG